MSLNRLRCGPSIRGLYRSFPQNFHRGFSRSLQCQSSKTEPSGAKNVRPYVLYVVKFGF